MARPGEEDACAAALRDYCSRQQLLYPTFPGARLEGALSTVKRHLSANTMATLKAFVRNQRPMDFAIVMARSGAAGGKRSTQWLVFLKLPPPAAGAVRGAGAAPGTGAVPGAGAAAGTGEHHCALCKVNCPSTWHLLQHCASAKHRRRADAAAGAGAAPGAGAAGRPRCNLCGVFADNQEDMASHLAGKAH